ncbi:hypothetical protein [Xenorhabdus szentirmaii]|uniref:Uncharacterized protein n=1 Tax=Xenorhabdus szentirmaii DSM 16338 TaxID=1427518 RepID=W1IZ93_9GAMM|nr:hypothetical protein [Xenorhabdus szentirmaii]PHM30891.1 hypothetical protein Xsze_04007 [Xenorhabdus szentirmaii DSM 16338]PHM40364.1 hypothetical protein Xszus_00021 [Xenorhabdus szentirmaii]CDL83779.1 hypothetical protein XSR1_360057 [Xenorhabdus szentirmaii DSM 16338]
MKCSAQFVEGTEEWIKYKQLEEKGKLPEYAALREQLSKETLKINIQQPDGQSIQYEVPVPLFQYGKADIVDDNIVYADGKYQLTTRVGGLMQAAGGAVEIIGGTVFCATPATCVGGAIVATQGMDNLNTGTNILTSGKPVKTMGAKGLEALGVPPEYSEITYAGIGLGGSLTTVLTSPKTGKSVTVLMDKDNRITRSFSNNSGTGNKTENSLPQWSVGEGKYSPKNQGTVTNVEHPTGKFDGKLLAKVDEISPVHPIIDTKPSIGTKIDKSVVVIEKEMLPPSIIGTFKSSRYETVITQEPITLFRKFGGTKDQAKLNGGYATTIKNAGRNDTAVYKMWSTTRFEAEIEVPKNIKLNIGFVEKQNPDKVNPKYTGGADQILLPMNYPMDWVKSIRDGKTGKIYTFEEFKKTFPDQISR